MFLSLELSKTSQEQNTKRAKKKEGLLVLLVIKVQKRNTGFLPTQE